ncbi:NAD(P)-dependent oxidoreductase [Pseudoroseomonas wenyumeiae]|uniref:NAD(P)-dependent oxidoreductase n=1 Tax=Teichococcus wenyumeiae TaxID=2478470 RepID=A0A3A9J1J5_9PROT|nr:NAD(P)-dependent oxidoreductase [Pseudoroseomonas wenyumeiae]RKK01077.1 NAD(P)-dependent oxidoreductase [Pseudoroseomonas wenyumeiae]RMI15485.1 NAD(P)-dependent oxidoreductase [Pseudoroseomonas wenyumeiae]
MSSAPILLMGGSGAIGRWTTRFLRAAHPGLPLLIGGRNLTKAQEAAARIDNAEGVALELAAADLGLGGRPVSAVAVLFSDESLAGLRFAQASGVPHLSISSGIYEIAPEIAAFMHKPHTAPLVLGYEWLVGATTVPTLEFAKAFSRVDDIAIGALVDEQDTGGPAVAEDFERLNRTLPAALTRREGRYIWRAGQDAKATFHAVDGTRMEASGFSSIDVVGLATATGAANVQFNIATGVSSSRRRGEPMSTEIVIELAGQDHAGLALRTRHAIVHREGSAPLTGLGVAMILERLLGLDGHPATPTGLYFPYQLLHPTAYFTRLEQIGGEILTLGAR